MTPEMLAKSRATAGQLGFDHVEFREGLAEALPVEDGWADVVISNGVINLCADKQAVFAEIRRVLRARRVCCSSPTSPTAARSRPRRCATSTCGPVELPAGCPVRAGRQMLEDSGFDDVRSVHPSTPSAVPSAKPTPGRSRSTATPSSHAPDLTREPNQKGDCDGS